MLHHDDPPTMEELKAALFQLKLRKEGGLLPAGDDFVPWSCFA